jgi:hypothetical protein
MNVSDTSSHWILSNLKRIPLSQDDEKKVLITWNQQEIQYHNPFYMYYGFWSQIMIFQVFLNLFYMLSF